MDRIKYRKAWLAYFTDMKSLEVENPEIWNNFMEGNFSVQKSVTPEVAVGCDHAGEQINRKDKMRWIGRYNKGVEQT